MPEPMLEVRDLVVRYGAIEVVHGIGFEVREGEVAALIGANGAGKTSTLMAISGLLRPARGSIRLAGRELAGAAPHTIVRAGLIQVPEGREILARMSVHENLLLSGATDVRAIYERFPILAERRWLPAGNLSGGSSSSSRSPARCSRSRACSCWTNRHWGSRRRWSPPSSRSSRT